MLTNYAGSYGVQHTGDKQARNVSGGFASQAFGRFLAAFRSSSRALVHGIGCLDFGDVAQQQDVSARQFRSPDNLDWSAAA